MLQDLRQYVLKNHLRMYMFKHYVKRNPLSLHVYCERDIHK